MDKKQKQKLEFSKKIMIVAMTVNILVILFACIMIWITQDLSPLMYIIPAVAAEVATGTGFYYNKAKAENKLKLMKAYKVQPTEDSFSDL